MKPIKNEDTQAKCIEWASMVASGHTLEASNSLRQWVAERPKLKRWEFIAIQDQVRFLAGK